MLSVRVRHADDTMSECCYSPQICQEMVGQGETSSGHGYNTDLYPLILNTHEYLFGASQCKLSKKNDVGQGVKVSSPNMFDSQPTQIRNVPVIVRDYC